MPEEKQRRVGRPTRSEGPSFPVDEVDRLLVHGEPDENGRQSYPSYREIAERYGVSHSVIGDYASRHNCQGRREAAQQSIRRQADETLIDLRAKKLALEENDIASMVDLALMKVLTMLQEGRLRCDTTSDMNLLVRLREFLRGNADSRQEMLGGMTLEELEKRRLSALARIRTASPAARGRVCQPSDSEPAGVQESADSEEEKDHE